ncbi:MAG: outer membrane protein assembly factor BamA [Pseudomonadota bacterium]
MRQFFMFVLGFVPSTARNYLGSFLLFFCIGLICAIFSPNMVAAQSVQFSNLVVEGNERIEDATILNQAGINPGDRLNAGQINAASRRIRESGLFEEVNIETRGRTLVITVSEFPTINRVVFEGNKRIDDDALTSFVESAPRQVYSPTRAERDAAVLVEAYEQNGRVSARITPRIIRRSDNRVDLVFEIFEGRPIEVRRISFVGNRQFSDRRLRRALESKQAGLLRAIINRDTFVADRLEFDRQVLSDFYMARGYVDFRVTDVNAELTRERDGFFVTFNVQEGQQFRFGEITTVSEIPGLDPEPYQAALRLKSGKVYTPVGIETSIARMERLGIQQGVDFLRIEPVITRNDRDLTLDVEFLLTRGDRIFVERIDIEGNATTLDRVIRNQFDVVEGDPFNPRQIRQAADRIRALRFFQDVQVEAREGSRPDQVIVDVDVEETSTGSLSFGGSFNSDSGFGLSIGLTERNFLGRGQSVTANIAGTGETANFNLSFAEPAFLGRDVEFRATASLLETDSNNSNFDTIIGTLRPQLTFPLNDRSRLSTFYQFGYTELDDFTGASPTLAAETEVGGLFKSSVGVNYIFDTRRTGLNPDAGVLFDIGVEVAGVGGDQQFVRPSLRLVGQRRLLRGDVVLRATLEAGAIEFFGGESSRAVDRFSQQVIRGFDANGIGPSQGGEQLGGNYFSALKFDVEFPIGLPDEFGISGGLFYDIGSIWGLDDSIGVIDSESFRLRQSIGVSLFWNSPFGPLRLNFSRVLQSEPDDVERNFDITVRTEF